MRPEEPSASPSFDEHDTIRRPPEALATDQTMMADPRRDGDRDGDRDDEGPPLKTIDRDGYKIEGHFAQGGIGRILRARDRYLGRPVALKELLVAGRGEAERRFVREALLTARLQHPGIVPIYEAGRWPSGEAFYAMKLVSGRALFDIISDTKGLDERLALLPNMLALSEAVAYAHAQAVIHRDLKPENVLIGEFGETIVIDWGLAKDLAAADDPRDSRPHGDLSEGADSQGADLTMDGAVMGTPSYMAPEQAEGKAVDARADVYALGSILYHLLTGAPPYDASTAMAIVVKVVTEDPIPVTVRQPGVPRDLVAILDKAMAREPGDRYPSAKELADDLRRFQTGKLVAAHHYSARERLWRWISRNRAALAVAAIALVIVTVIGGASIRSVIHEKEAARAAASAARSAEEQATRRADALAIEQARHLASTLPARALDLLGGVVDRSQWRRLRVIAADADAHGVATALVGHEAGVSRLAFSPESALLATTSDDCTVRIWDLRGGHHQILSGHRDQVWRIAFSPDGSRLATTSKDATVRIWDPATGELVRSFVGDAPTRALAFTSTGAQVIASDDTGELRAWSLASGASTLLTRCEASFFFTNGRAIGCVAVDRRSIWLGDASGGEGRLIDTADLKLSVSGALSADGRYMAVAGENGVLWLWDLTADQRHRLEAGSKRLRSVVFSPASDRVAAGADDHNAYLFDTATRARLHVLTGAASPVIRLEFSPDGEYLVGVAPEPRIHLWNLADGDDHPLAGLAQSALAATFSPDGRTIAGVGVDGDLRLWEPGELVSRRLGDPSLAQIRVMLAPDAATIISGASDGSIYRWRLGEALPQRLGAHAKGVQVIRFADSGQRFITADEDGAAILWSGAGDKIADLPSPVGAVTPLTFLLTKAGARAVAIYDREVVAWDLEARAARRLGINPADPQAVSLSADEREVFIADTEGQVSRWDLGSGERRVAIRQEGRIVAIDVSRDGSLLISGGDEHKVHVKDLITDEEWTLPTQGLEVRALAIHPDGRRAAVTVRNNVISLWDLRARTLERTLSGHSVAVDRLTFTEDGLSMVSLGLDGSLRIWDLESGESRALPTSANIQEFRASADGRIVLTRTYDSNDLRIWRDDLPRDQAGFFRWLDAARTPIAGPPLPAETAALCPGLGDGPPGP